MPQHPTAPVPTVNLRRDQAEQQPKKAADLTVNKVLAGAGAAATSAVLGSYFGAAGTVAGAALGSVASTVTTTLYQRSLDRTRDTIAARVRRRTDFASMPTVQLAVPAPRESPEAAAPSETQVQPVLRPPRRMWLWAGATVLVFVIGMLVVTGIEWAKGSTVGTSETGTSVGRVFDGGRGSGAPAADDETSTPEPTAEPTSTEEPTTSESTEEPTATDEPESSSATSTPASEDEDRRSQRERSAEDGGASDAVPTPLVPVPADPRTD